jgi:hypothetical protein
MEKNEMQDAERLREQVGEMIAKAQAKADVASAHYELVAERKKAEERNLAKFKFLSEVFTFGENLMRQRRENLRQAEEKPGDAVFEGLDDTLLELERLMRQVQDASKVHEGSVKVLSGLEEAFREEKTQATSRARGLAVQGQRAVEVAAGRTVELEGDEEKSEEGSESPMAGLVDPSFSAKESIASR